MDVKLSNALKREYPRVLSEIDYLSVGNGWHFIIDQLCYKLEWNMTENWRMYPTVKAVQIKEKLGMLRFYVETKPYTFDEYARLKEAEGDTNNDYATYIAKIKYYEGYMHGQISLMESLSLKFCENCGVMDDVRIKSGKSGWLKCYCPKCHKNSEKIRKKMWDDSDAILAAMTKAAKARKKS